MKASVVRYHGRLLPTFGEARLATQCHDGRPQGIRNRCVVPYHSTSSCPRRASLKWTVVQYHTSRRRRTLAGLSRRPSSPSRPPAMPSHAAAVGSSLGAATRFCATCRSFRRRPAAAVSLHPAVRAEAPSSGARAEPANPTGGHTESARPQVQASAIESVRRFMGRHSGK